MARTKSETLRRSESVVVPMTRSMRRQIEAKAKQQGWPLAEVARQAFRSYLRQKDPKGVNGEGKP
jgi:hypothetical protein